MKPKESRGTSQEGSNYRNKAAYHYHGCLIDFLRNEEHQKSDEDDGTSEVKEKDPNLVLSVAEVISQLVREKRVD